MRIIAGFNPDIDPLKWGWDAINSRNAIISGGFRGAGLFGGEAFKAVHANHSDFIFMVLCEKLGFLGAFAYIAFNEMCIRDRYTLWKAETVFIR